MIWAAPLFQALTKNTRIVVVLIAKTLVTYLYFEHHPIINMTNYPPQIEQYTQKVDAFMTKYPKITLKGTIQTGNDSMQSIFC
jgi:hypothetical protein